MKENLKAGSLKFVDKGNKQSVQTHLNELNIQLQGQVGYSDTNKTPTTRDPPFEPNAVNPNFDGMDLTEAISDLDNYIAALHGDFTPGGRKSKNLLIQLTSAIKELEASTAALECLYSDSTRASQSSLNSSSGYGTMNSTAAVSEDTIASCVEQPVNANLNELNVQMQGQGGDSDTDKTPKTVTRDPPFEPNAANPKYDGMDLIEAISDLYNYIAARHGDFTPGNREYKENLLLELAATIKELEASTALECSYSDSTRASQLSLNSSSGYGTMNSTPAVSVDTLASCGEQPVYANLKELNVQVQGQGRDSDTDKTPKTVTRDPPFEPNAANPEVNGQFDGMDLTEAISDLENYIAALYGDFTPGDRTSKQNLLGLAAASKDLEASTVALECSYSDSTRASQSSLNSSSGYGTMNSTPAVSVDTKASCDENKSQCWKDVENLTLNDAQLLFDKGLLPDRHILSVMVRRHGMKSDIVVLVCENICKTIAAVSSEFLHVFGAYDKENRLHFVVYTETESIQNSELDFDYEILFRSCKRNEQNDHMSIIAESEGELLAEESVALGKTVKSISKRFMDKHKYLSVITARKILSEGRENLCIVMYVHPCTDRYSSIPHTEDPIPTEIQGYKVVVRNGVFKTATKTAAEYHDNLRMGCQITSNHVNGFGTLGGFIDHPEYGLCGFTCAHVVCSSEQMVNLKRNKRLKWPTSDHCSVYQPSQHTMPVGRVVEAIYTEGGDSGSAGVDLALFQIENRPPVSGSFPRCNSNEKLRYNMGTTWGKSRIAPSVREVQKFGVATGITKGNVWFDGMSVRELPFVTKRALHSVDTILYNQYEVVNDIRHFCEQGDSGGLVFMKDCFNELICIGMVNGVLDTVSPFHGVVTPITDILRELNVQNLKPFKQELTLDNLEKRLSEHAAATRVQMQSHINESVSTAASNMLDKMMEVQSAFQREVQSSLAHMYALLQKQTPDSSTKTDGNNSGDE